MKPIFKSIYGSHLYGSNIATSDTDIKGVFLPSSQEILMGDIPSTFTQNSNKDSDRKNTVEDTDLQLFSLKKFIKDIVGGQTYALELLFSPEQFWLEKPDPIWMELVENRDKLVSKNVTAMVSYARAQAFKYGEKGKRLEVFTDVIDWFEGLPFRDRTVDFYISLNPANHYRVSFDQYLSKHSEFISIHKKENDISEVTYFDVNGVLVPVGCTVSYALSVFKPRLEEYGSRAKQAMADRGNDLKAIYHSIRIANQAEELLKTGTITLPRPEAPLLLAIRNGEVSDAGMKRLIDESFERVREAEKTSTLRPNADRKWANDFMMRAHLHVIQFDNQVEDKDDTHKYYVT
jgi:hypothetical protein